MKAKRRKQIKGPVPKARGFQAILKDHVPIHLRKRKLSTPQLSSPLGRLIDAASFLSLGLLTGILIGGFSLIYFSFQAFKINGVDVSSTIYDCLYFSVVTFSSLGYGDIAPYGWMRFVAGFEVLSGLILMALFVGKIASERQSALIRLLYTSDHERRVKSFAEELSLLVKQIDHASLRFDHDALDRGAKELCPFLGAIGSYLVFQSSQGSLLDFGNVSSLKKLYLTFLLLVEKLGTVARSRFTHKNASKEIDEAIAKVHHIGKDMISIHRNDKIENILAHLINMTEQYARNRICDETAGEGIVPLRHEDVTEFLIGKVQTIVERKGLYRHIQKDIGKELSIPNRLAERCIAEINRRRIIKRRPKVSTYALIGLGLCGLLFAAKKRGRF